MLKVIKRNLKDIVDFDKSKIVIAINKAGNGIDKKVSEDIAEEIYEEYKDSENITISTIEELVYNKLINKGFALTARAYEGYRSVRAFQRNNNSTDKTYEELFSGNSIYWNTENSNKNPKINSTLRDYTAGVVNEDISKRKLLTPEVVHAHEEGIIHFHDIDYFLQTISNCCLINLEDMLQNGTMINGIMIDKPKKFTTAMTIATQIITSVTSSQYGGTSISLTHLAPFVRDSYNKQFNRLQKFYGKKLYKKYVDEWQDKFGDKKDLFREFITYQMNDLATSEAKELTRKEIEDGVQTFNYQVNSMTTTNGQAPFITVFMYLNETEEYKDELAMIIEEFLHQRIVGMKNKNGVFVTPAFPKLIYVLEEDNIKENSKYWYLTELSAKCTAKRLVPDYISEKIMKKLKDGNCFPVMGCRSCLAPWKDENDNYKFYGRFNQGVVTLNLPDVALSSDKDLDKFWDLMEERTELCHRALLLRHNRLENTLSDVAPIMWQHGGIARLKQGENINKILHGGYSSISLGYAGIYECIKYMTGLSHTTEEGKELTIKVLEFMNNKCKQWTEEDDIGYSIYGSPIESTTYKFAKCLKKRFGIIEGITDKNYITNSYHIPVTEKIEAFDKLEKESVFQALSSGGAISYVETSNLSNNIPAVLEVIKFIYDTIMYAELNTKNDYCQECGYDGEILIDDDMNWYCPNCGNRDMDTMNVARRTCGYIGTNGWNYGRTQEIKERYIHLDDQID